MKNVFIYLAIFVLASSLAFGASVTLSPVETYESVDADLNIEVDNYLGSEVINKVILNSPDLEIQDVLQFIGWTSDFSPSQITWSDGTIETNIRNALFVFTANAPLVSQDESYVLAGELHYTDLIIETYNITLTILDDTTLPVLNNLFPADGGYARAHESLQNIIVNASDPETGIKDVKYKYSDCSNNVTQVMLSCNNGFCSGIADFTNYGEDDTACFTVTITNNADDSNVITGSFGFDETPPTVTLISPINNEYGSGMFSFDVQDNKANQFDCRLEIDSIELQDVEAYTGVNAFAITAVIDEGMHDWKIICADAVDLEGEAEDSFIYDITPPTITLNSPENNAAIKDEVIDITVSDNYEVASVDYSLDLDSTNWNDGWNTLTVTATDSAGNVNEQSFDFFVDRQAPVIEIISPLNNESFDYHGNFVITATDNVDELIECGLSTSVSDPVSAEVNSGEQSTIQAILPLGQFTWSVLCVDDLGNSAQSDTMNAVAEDLTGPDIVIQDITDVARGSDMEVIATITDISLIKEAKAVFEGDEITLTANGDQYSGTFSIPADLNLGDYIVEVIAIDNSDQVNSVSDEFTVVEASETEPVSESSSGGSGSSGIPFDFQGGFSGIKPEEPAPAPSGEASASELIEEPETPVIEEELPEEEPRVPEITGATTGIVDSLGSLKWAIIALLSLGLILGAVHAFYRFRKKKSKDGINWGSKFG